MTRAFSRRKLITTGLATAAGAAGLTAAARLANRYGLIPPDHNGVYGIGETLTYASQRLLLARHPLAREFDRTHISKVFPVNGEPPQDDDYRRLLSKNFAPWCLDVDGLVDRPASFSLAELKRYPVHTQLTHLACEEGWSYIAEWTGLLLSDLLHAVGIQPHAKFVAFFPYDENWDSLDLTEALHPQTLLAYAMNGQDLPTPHGAPLRLRVPRQLGYKSVKYLAHIQVADTLKDFGSGRGSISPDLGYSWYAGI